MDNIESAIKSADKLQFTKKEKRKLILEAKKVLGEDKQIVMVIEEIAELINAVSSDINNDFDYYHTAEEVTDVIIMANSLEAITGIKMPKLKNDKPSKKSIKIFMYIEQLSKAQQNLSKYIRHKPSSSKEKISKVAQDKVIQAMQLMLSAANGIAAICNIKRKDINRIMNIKYKRLSDRIKHKDVK